MLSDDLGGWDGWMEGRLKKEEICDSLCCASETNTILKRNFTPINIHNNLKMYKVKELKLPCLKSPGRLYQSQDSDLHLFKPRSESFSPNSLHSVL